MIPTYEELGTNLQWKKRLLFTGVFFQENRLHAICDRNNELSVKQWLLLAVTKGFDEPQDLSTLARAMGCSRQNVKKLAITLEKSGYVELVKSKKDSRSLCVKRTSKGDDYNERTQAYGQFIHQQLFHDFSDEEINIYYDLWVKFNHGIDRLEQTFYPGSEETDKERTRKEGK